MLLISHDLGVASRMCRRVAVMYAGTIVESAPRNVRRQEPLQGIPGAIPNLISPPAGCRFHPRCPRVMSVCSQVEPLSKTISAEHTVACHLF